MADTVCAFIFDRNTKTLRVLDQTLLPRKINYVNVPDSERGHSVIKNMMVRGAPCIAAIGCLSIIAELNQSQFCNDTNTGFSAKDLIGWLQAKASYLITARPTAVNLKNALDKLLEHANSSLTSTTTNSQLVESLTRLCLQAIEGGRALNKQLGDFGAEELLKRVDKHEGVTVLTHCNTGTLATVGYGTALGIIRSLRNKGALKHVYCTETRPYLQGSRLTAWELVQERMPSTLIADSMGAYLMSTHKIDAVLVGADCVAINGDVANKIGTLQLAIVAKHFGVPFYVAAPTQSFDLTKENQDGIKIELRPSRELRRIDDIVLAPDEVDVWNPCFDVTPAALVSGFVTEYGVCVADKIGEFFSTSVPTAATSGDSNKFALF